MTTERVVTLSLIPQPIFPDHCFSCGVPTARKHFDVPVRLDWGVPMYPFLWPWQTVTSAFRSNPHLRVPACSRCEAQMNRVRALQFLGAFSGIVLLFVAACIAAVGGFSQLAGAVALVSGVGFAVTFGAWIWEGATVPLLVSVSVSGGSLRLRFDEARDQEEFTRLNDPKGPSGAG